MLPLLSEKEVTVVFANVEDILLTNTVSKTDYCSMKIKIRICLGVYELLGRTAEGMSTLC